MDPQESSEVPFPDENAANDLGTNAESEAPEDTLENLPESLTELLPERPNTDVNDPTETASTEGSGKAHTTLMIRNLPKTLKQGTLLAELDRTGFQGTYDFCYMPCSFESGEGKGYAFINFLSAPFATELTRSWHRTRRFGMRPNDLAMSCSPAVVQGLEANVAKWSTPRLSRVRNPDLRPFILSDKPDKNNSGKKYWEQDAKPAKPRKERASTATRTQDADTNPIASNWENQAIWQPGWHAGAEHHLLAENFSLSAHVDAPAMLPQSSSMGATSMTSAWPSPCMGKGGYPPTYAAASGDVLAAGWSQLQAQVAHMAQAAAAVRPVDAVAGFPGGQFFEKDEETTVLVTEIIIERKPLNTKAWQAWMDKNGYAGCYDSLQYFSADECNRECSSLLVNFIDPEDSRLFGAESELLISQFSKRPPVSYLVAPGDVRAGPLGVEWLNYRIQQ